MEKDDTMSTHDTLTEWRCLAAFIRYPEQLYHTTRNIFGEERADLFDTLMLTYAQDGQLTRDGIAHRLNGELPEELTADVETQPDVLIPRLKNMARRRQLENASHLLRTIASQYEPDEDAIRQALTFAPISPTQDVSLHSGSMHLQTDMKRKRSGDYVFARTGLSVFDAQMGGEWPRRSLVIIKALPGVGKTALACTSMLAMAENQQIRSHFWSLEMPKELLMIRWLANKLRIDNTRIQMATSLKEEELARIDRGITYIESLPMTVNESRPTIDEMISETHYLAQQGTRVFFFDYLQIANVIKYGNRNNDLGYFALQLKEMAKKYDATFVALSQVNDQQEVRDSGEVEQVADTSIFMYPDDKPDTDGVVITRARWDKNRTGPVGKDVALRFNGKYQVFQDVTDD